jgi:hypothetical protein
MLKLQHLCKNFLVFLFRAKNRDFHHEFTLCKSLKRHNRPLHSVSIKTYFYEFYIKKLIF